MAPLSAPWNKLRSIVTARGLGQDIARNTARKGIYADPAVYPAKNKPGDEADLSMIKDAFQAMKQQNPLGGAMNTLNETLQMAKDMDGLFLLNSCVSPGVKRLPENIVLFSVGSSRLCSPAQRYRSCREGRSITLEG